MSTAPGNIFPVLPQPPSNMDPTTLQYVQQLLLVLNVCLSKLSHISSQSNSIGVGSFLTFGSDFEMGVNSGGTFEMLAVDNGGTYQPVVEIVTGVSLASMVVNFEAPISINGSANYLEIAGSAATIPLVIGAGGTDTNISIQLEPKGTGIVQAVGSLASTGAFTSGASISAAGNIVSGGTVSAANGEFASTTPYYTFSSSDGTAFGAVAFASSTSYPYLEAGIGTVVYTGDGAINTNIAISPTGSGAISLNAAATVTGALTMQSALTHSGTAAGFFGTTPTSQPTVTGAKGGNAALASLCTELAALGLIINSTT